MDINAIHITSNLKEQENGLWSGLSKFLIENLDFKTMDKKSIFQLQKADFSGFVKDYNPEINKVFLDEMAKKIETPHDTPENLMNTAIASNVFSTLSKASGSFKFLGKLKDIKVSTEKPNDKNTKISIETISIG